MTKEKKLTRSELSRRAWQNPETRRALLAGAKKAGLVRKQRYPKRKVIWICKDRNCGLEILSANKPEPRTWASGHTCHYVLKKIKKK